MADHTPGPWRIVVGGYATTITAALSLVDNASLPIARIIHDDSGRGRREDTANASLIAAAPELLAALDNLLAAYLHTTTEGKSGYVIANRNVAMDAAAAIAKARRESR